MRQIGTTGGGPVKRRHKPKPDIIPGAAAPRVNHAPQQRKTVSPIFTRPVSVSFPTRVHRPPPSRQERAQRILSQSIPGVAHPLIRRDPRQSIAGKPTPRVTSRERRILSQQIPGVGAAPWQVAPRAYGSPREEAYRNALIHNLIAHQGTFNNISGGIAVGPRELRAKLTRLPTTHLEALQSWRPNQTDLLRGQVSTAGPTFEGLSRLAALTGHTISGAVRSGIPGKAGEILGNAAGDLIEIPGEAVPSVYFAAKPLTSGNVKEAARRFTDPFVQLAEHPVQSFVEHPLGTALMASGAVGGLGRGAGFLARHGTPAMREFGSLDRGLAELPGTNFKDVRRYSPNLATKRVQVRRDAARTRKADRLYAEAKATEAKAIRIQKAGGNAEAKFRAAAHKRAQAFDADPRIITDRSKASRVTGKTVLQRGHDEFESLAEGLRRLDRSRVVKEATRALGRKPSNLTRPVVEGIVAASRKHVEHYLEQIKQEARRLDPVVDRSKLLANEQLQGQLRKALDNPKTDLGHVLATAERYVNVVRPRQQELMSRNLLPPERGELAALRPYEIRYMGSRVQPAHWVTRDGERISESEARSIQLHQADWRNHIVHIPERVVGPHGRPFTAAQIRAHIRQQTEGGAPFVSDPAYVSQKPYLRSSGAYFQRWNPRVGVQSSLRSGEAVRQGTIDAHPSTLVDQAARTQSLLSADKAFEAHINEFAYRAHGEVLTVGTRRQAQEMAQALDAHGSPVKWRPVRLNPLGANPEALTELLDATKMDEFAAHKHVHESLADAYRSTDGPGPWTLIPEQVAERAYQFQKLLGAQQGVKAVQKVSSVFRRVVLQRPSFLIGNDFEATLRGALKGALPLGPDYFLMRRILDALPAKHRDSVLEGIIGGGHMHMAARAHIHRPVDQLGEGRVAQFAKGVAHTKVARAITDMWDRWNHLYFEEINARIERQFRIALAGKEIRQQLLPGRLLVVSKKSVQEAADGLTDTPTQRLMGRLVDRAYGQYDKFTPEQRRWLMLYTPFAAWMLNSIRFAAQVLPRDHPVVTSLLAAATQTSQDYRDAHGLTQLGGADTKRVPGFLQGTIPGGDSSFLRAFTRYTPAGFWSDPLNSLGTAVLPQFSGVESAFKGTDWKGTPLKDTSTFGRLAEAVKEFGGSVVPGLGQGEQVFSGKGTLDGRARKFFDPFMYTKSAQVAQRTGQADVSGLTPAQQRAFERVRQRSQAQRKLTPAQQRVLARLTAGR